MLTVDRPGLAETRGLLELHVVAGPDSGAVHRLSPGEHGIGRSVEATIRIDDPDVSRLHAVLRVATDGSGTTVHDLASTNGTTVRRRACGWLRSAPSARVDAAGWRHPVPPGHARSGARLMPTGRRRPPRGRTGRRDTSGRSVPVRLTVPTEPPARERGRFPLLAILLPLVAGVALVAITRSPTYLLFILLSPLMALGTFWSDRPEAGGRRGPKPPPTPRRWTAWPRRWRGPSPTRQQPGTPPTPDPRPSPSRSADPGPGCGSDDPSTTTPSSCGWASARSPPLSRCARPGRSATGSMRSSTRRSTKLRSPSGWPRPAYSGWPVRGSGCCRWHVRWSPSWRAGTAHGTCASSY